MEQTLKQIAGELAEEMDMAISSYASGWKEGESALRQILWDNKMGILRVLQAAAKE